MSLEFTFEHTDMRGRATTRNFTDDNSASSRDDAMVYFFRALTTHVRFADTKGVQVKKIVSKTTTTGRGDFAPINNANMNATTPEQHYRVQITGRTYSGGSVSELKQYMATSGADAMLKFWNELKSSGAGFCGTAATVVNLTITVLVRPPVVETVLFEEAPAATVDASDTSDLPSGQRNFGGIRASYDETRNRARIVSGGAAFNYTAQEAWDEYVRYRRSELLRANEQGRLFFRALDYVTDYTSRHRPTT